MACFAPAHHHQSCRPLGGKLSEKIPGKIYFRGKKMGLRMGFLRFGESNQHLDQLIEEVRQFRPSTDMLEATGPTQRRAQRKKTTIKQLFTAASKFQKHLKRYWTAIVDKCFCELLNENQIKKYIHGWIQHHPYLVSRQFLSCSCLHHLEDIFHQRPLPIHQFSVFYLSASSFFVC